MSNFENFLSPSTRRGKPTVVCGMVNVVNLVNRGKPVNVALLRIVAIITSHILVSLQRGNDTL
jgi:hypothetical protein